LKKYRKEIIILIIQIILFYILPLIANNISKDAMVITIFLNMIFTFIMSLIIYSISKYKIKYLYPILVFILFIPSGCIYYPQWDAIIIYALFHLIVSLIVMLPTYIYNLITNREGN
jgi:hypothetical protein